MGEIPPIPIGVNRIICGDCIEEMRKFPADFFDSIITDPPYGLGFMGKEWDTFNQTHVVDRQHKHGRKSDPKREGIAMAAGEYDQSLKAHLEFQQWFTQWAKECLRVAKPGAIMLVFGGTRTFHRLTCAIEDAGWQIRDCMMWLYGSGFPKSHDISKAIDKAAKTERKVVGKHPNPAGNRPGGNSLNMSAVGMPETADITIPATVLARKWDGYGTALKPAWEPIIVAMKPLDGTFAQNAEKYGVAGLNIDKGRILAKQGEYDIRHYTNEDCFQNLKPKRSKFQVKPQPSGRWPANLILNEEAAGMLDEQSGVSKSSGGSGKKSMGALGKSKYGKYALDKHGQHAGGLGDAGGASRFFYIAKASKKERNAGLENLPEKPRGPVGDGMDNTLKGPTNALRKDKPTLSQNNHPTVKPLALMEYLCKLTKTPDGGIVLDPFGGSGTTALACIKTGRKYVLIEKEMEYCEIARQRVKNLMEK